MRPAVTALVPGGPARPPHAHHAAASPARSPRPSRLSWAALYRRVVREALEVCPRCAGPMKVLAAVTDPDVARAILTHLDLPTETPPIAPARAPPQLPIWPGAFDPPPDLDAFDPA